MFSSLNMFYVATSWSHVRNLRYIAALYMDYEALYTVYLIQNHIKYVYFVMTILKLCSG